MTGLWATLNRRERGFVFACTYLGALFVSCIVMWWLVLVGGNPFTVENVGSWGASGPQTEFHPGDIVGVRRKICATGSIGAQFFPALRDSNGFLFPLPIGMVESATGCKITTYGFILPDLPDGKYTFTSVMRFQTNLVGRDETTTLPLITIEVTR